MLEKDFGLQVCRGNYFDETVLKTHHMSRSIWFEGLGLVVSQLGLPTLDIA